MTKKTVGKGLYKGNSDGIGRGLPVEDAKKNLYFYIDPVVAKKATPLNGAHCAIADNLFGQYPGLLAVEIGAHSSFLILENKVFRYLTPDNLRDGLNRFDGPAKDWGLKKGVYHLSRPYPSQTREKLREEATKKRPDRNKNKEGVRYGVTGRCSGGRSLNPRQLVRLEKAKGGN